MNWEHRPLVTDDPVEFEINLVKVEDFRKITHHFVGIYRIYLKLMKRNRKITTCTWLDLETLAF